MNLLGLFSPTGTLPVLHREIGGQPAQPAASADSTKPSDAAQPAVRGGSYAERIAYARSPQAALTISAVYHAVEMRGDTFAVMPVQYHYKDAVGGNFTPWMTGQGKRMNYILQEEPNPLMSGADLWKQVVINRQMLGNGFVYVERDAFGDVRHLWLAISGGYNMATGTYQIVYMDDYGIVEIPAAKRENVLHFPNSFRYYNGHWGIPTLKYACETLSLLRTQKQQALENAAKGGRVKLLIGEERTAAMSGTMVGGMYDKSEMKKYAEEINDTIYQQDVVSLRGLDRVQSISMSQQEMQMVEQMNLGLDDVARFWGTPRPLLMLDTNSHYNDYQNATMEYLQRTILPEKVEFEKEISRKLIGKQYYGSRRIHICEQPLLAMDPERQAKVDQLHLQMGWTVNEIRASHDMPSIEGGDVPYLSTNLAELGSEKLRSNGGGRPSNEPSNNDDEKK